MNGEERKRKRQRRHTRQLPRYERQSHACEKGVERGEKKKRKNEKIKINSKRNEDKHENRSERGDRPKTTSGYVLLRGGGGGEDRSRDSCQKLRNSWNLQHSKRPPEAGREAYSQRVEYGTPTTCCVAPYPYSRGVPARWWCVRTT